MTSADTGIRRRQEDRRAQPAPERRRLTMHDELLSFRAVSILPAVLFVPTIAGEVALPGTKVGTIFGIVYHLMALFFVARVPAPSWAKAAGFSWIALDVAVGVMDVNLVPEHIYMPMRLGGHVLAAVWIVAVSLLSRSIGFRVVGLITAVMLAGYSFLGTILPLNFLTLPGVGTVVWFVLAGLRSEPDPLGGIRPRSRTSASSADRVADAGR